MSGTAKLTLHQLRAVGTATNRAPRLAKLAEFINDQCGDQVIATCEASETNTDRHYKGSRLRWPGKGRKGNALKVNARVELQLKGFCLEKARRLSKRDKPFSSTTVPKLIAIIGKPLEKQLSLSSNYKREARHCSSLSSH
jgi:hypothetical protein